MPRVVAFMLYLPALVVAPALSGSAALVRASEVVPAGAAGLDASVVAPLADPLVEALPEVGLLLAAFWVFDRLLPTLETLGAGFEGQPARPARPEPPSSSAQV